MPELIIKCILFLFGLLLIKTPDILSVAAFLAAVTLTSLNGFFGRRRFTLISSLVYCGISTFIPAFCPFMPLFCFDLFSVEPRVLTGLAIIPLLASISRREPADAAFLIILTLLALLLRYLCDKTDRLANENIIIKDNSREQSRILELQNKNLRDKQDYEVHLATLKERNRIAREIHDNVGHILSRSILQAGALQTLNKDTAMENHFTELKNTLTLAMDNIRGSVHDLKDESVDLRDTLVQMLEMDGYIIQFNYDVSGSVPNEVKYCFITVVKEALTNIVKHSDATIIRVAVQEHPAIYQLLIHDNGTKKPSRESGGMGLSNMEERVRALGGHYNADYQAGFRIFISIPRPEDK